MVNQPIRLPGSNLAPGEYPATVKRLTFEMGRDGLSIMWTFVLSDPKHQGKVLLAWAPAFFKPASKLHSWAQQFAPTRPIPPEWQFDGSKFIGRHIMLVVSVRCRENGQPYNRVERLLPIPGRPREEAANPSE